MTNYFNAKKTIQKEDNKNFIVSKILRCQKTKTPPPNVISVYMDCTAIKYQSCINTYNIPFSVFHKSYRKYFIAFYIQK